MSTKSNEAAFARPASSTFDAPQEGLTKREYFAAIALQGMIANYGDHEKAIIVESSVEMADALIKELNKKR